MKLKEYRKRLHQDPEYIAAKHELKPFLDLADNVLYLRLEKDWSQSELARRVGTRQANISRIESGLANPTVKFLQRLAQAFGVEVKDLLRPQQPTEDIKVIYVPIKTDLPWKERRGGEIAWNVLSKTDMVMWQR